MSSKQISDTCDVGFARPFLKWAGGKGQLIDQIQHHLPKQLVLTGKLDSYFEPFVGGGAIFFWLNQEFQIKNAYLYDINPEIVTAYQTIQSRPKDLIEKLREFERAYINARNSERETIFYEKRDEYNSIISKKNANHKIVRTALMIFLNKTCFNGLFRVNSKGEFNVPSGRYKNPTICNEDNLWAVHEALQNTQIACADFTQCLENANKNSFIYFDPPYRPISRTANFTGYIKGGFSDDDQRRLKEVFDDLNATGADVMLSNSDPKNINKSDNFFDDLYNNYSIQRITASRMINSNSSKRGSITELLITNYDS